ncbi:MAG: POTRA domain-containing protein [Bacteroidota bacterium]
MHKLFFIFLLFNLTWNAQAKDLIVQRIDFQGNKKTKTTYLQSIINCKVGARFIEGVLEEDVQRLKNIAGIGNASGRADTLGKAIHLTFTVEEVRTLLPIIAFGGIRDNVWFQVGVTDINWQGKGQFLSAHYQNNDRRNSGQFNYVVPFFRNTQWGFRTTFAHWESREPLFFPEGTVNYDYDNTSFALQAIRHFGINNRLEFGGSYFVENYAQSELQFLENPPGPSQFRQPKWLSKIEYNQNYLDYHIFFIDGFRWLAQWQSVYNTTYDEWFNFGFFQGFYFKRFQEKGNLAMRLNLGVTTNNNSPFAAFVVDSHVNIRGVGNRIERGTAQAVLNVEYRQTLFQTNRFAGQLVAFSDLGTWRTPGGDFQEMLDPEQFRHFVGGGVRLIYKRIYGAVLRIDYGFDLYDRNQRGLVLGLGQYF